MTRRQGRSLAREAAKSEWLDEEVEVSLAERAYKELEELIVTGALAPSAVLSESVLARRLGIGRTPIREALQRLVAEGLVLVLPRRGILVADISVQTHLKLLEVRRPLDQLMAKFATARSSEREKEQFRAVAAEMDKASKEKDGMAFIRLDRKLNALISAAADNDFLSKTMGLMQGLSRRFWFFYYEQIVDLALCARLHASLARAIADGDENAAGRAADRLNDFNESFTRAALDAKKRPARPASSLELPA